VGGRLAAYLEQSTRYIPYDDLVHGRFRYHVPRELDGDLRRRYVETLDAMFETYRELLPGPAPAFLGSVPQDAQTSDAAYRTSIRAKALDTLRGLLRRPRRRTSESTAPGRRTRTCCCAMRAHPLAEVRSYADAMARRAAQGDSGVSSGASTCPDRAEPGLSTWRRRAGRRPGWPPSCCPTKRWWLRATRSR